MDRSGNTPSLPILRPVLLKGIVLYGRWRSRREALAGCCLLFGLFLTAPTSADITGTVTTVIDGDTVQILDDGDVAYEVHLRCADAPELGQEAGVASAAYLSGLIDNKDVVVETVAGDEDGQLFGTVTLRGADINFRMIRAGFAWHANEDRCGPAWDAAQRRAQQSGRGLWANPAPVPPWDYRQLQE